jgi:hypothetical protein
LQFEVTVVRKTKRIEREGKGSNKGRARVVRGRAHQRKHRQACAHKGGKYECRIDDDDGDPNQMAGAAMASGTSIASE